MNEQERKYPIDTIVKPFQKFLQQEKSGGILLGVSVLVAMILANSPWTDAYFHFFEHKLGFVLDGVPNFNFTIHHWINDGLMSIFFFVVGLELKREFVGGALSKPRDAMLPIGAALGGMVVPAAIYLLFNSAETQHGWGIPMATDIAFALGVLYLLGNKVPLALKVFLMALAIVDDLGAVIVIALFYTEDISMLSLFIGLGFAVVMYAGNRLGVRHVLFYAILGIAGVWTAFLMSGVHATIASVIAAFTIPADVRLNEASFIGRIQLLLNRFRDADINDRSSILTNEQLHILDKVKTSTNQAIPPLQKLEHAMHPMVTYVVIPIFALANAGVSLNIDFEQLFNNHIAIGVALGLLLGKVVGVVGATWLMVKLKWGEFPQGMNLRNLIGLGFIASIGFTMSLFIANLAFTNPEYIMQSKIGIFTASIIGGITGYLILNKNASNKTIQ